MCRVSARRLSIYNFAWEPEGNEFASWIQNPKKIIGTANLSIKTKNF
jgi:uncharacterized protein with WD repeat